MSMFDINNNPFEFDKSTCTITKYNSIGVTHLDIPSEINGLAVKMIGDCAFKDCKELEFVNIPEGVEYIGMYAFYKCFKLKYISLSESVKSISNFALFYCTNLTSINIPKGEAIMRLLAVEVLLLLVCQWD